MKLRRLAIQRLPGIDDPFSLDELGDGFHVIVGPNGIGKSSLCRAVESLLWADAAPVRPLHVSAVFELRDQRWSVLRDGPSHAWQCDGVEAQDPALPAAHLRGCFFLNLRDLLELAPDAGQDVARAIRRQMAGGFDLEKPAADLFDGVGPHVGRRERNQFEQADLDVKRAERGHADVRRREDELSDLQARADAAELARRRVVHVETALGLKAQRDDLADVERGLGELPDALERLTGDEARRVEERTNELGEKEGQRRDAEGERVSARAAAEATRLGELLEPAALDTWRARADGLDAVATRLEIARTERHGTDQAVVEASRLLGGREDAAADLDLEDGASLLAFLREAREEAEARLAVEERLRLLGGREQTQEDRDRLDLLRRGVEALRSWLRMVDPDETAGAADGRRKIALGVGLALLVAGAGGGLAVDPRLLLVAATGLGLALGSVFSRPFSAAGSAAAAALDAARGDFPANLDAPGAWERPVVTDLLRRLEADLARLEASTQHAREREIERGELENRCEGLEPENLRLAARRRELAAELGLPEITEDADLVETARALADLRQARLEARDAIASEETLAASHAALLADLTTVLRQHGETEPTDAASARAGVAHLRERNASLQRARLGEKAAKRTLDALEEDMARIREAIVRIYREAGLEASDHAGLVRLIGDLESYNDLRRRRTSLAEAIAHEEGRLSSAGELALAELDAPTLEGEKQHLEQQAATVDGLRDEIAEIRAEVRQASQGHALEEAIAARDAALGELRDRRYAALHAAAGRFLLGAVEQEHEQNQMPRVLERARALFAAFTHHVYDLRIAPDDADSFRAFETRTGTGLRPDQLSDGTRVQLLLAARIAFAEDAEEGAALPLFLDEALDHSDPVRFRAIVRSLGRIVSDSGRQIFYLTNDPSDIHRIDEALAEEGCTAAKVVDLAAVRGLAAGVSESGDLHVPPLPTVPGPAGHSAETYGAALGVPPLDPQRGATAQHLFHLLWDDLDLLRRLLTNRIEYVGAWLSLRGGGAELARQIAAGDGIGSQLDARAELLDAFCHARREGRGRPVDREALEQSKAVRKEKLEHVLAVARELDGDAQRLLAVFRDPSDKRLSGFHSKTIKALEDYLTREGQLDARPLLSGAEINMRLLATPAAARLPEGLAAACSHRWWQQTQ